MSFRYRQFLAAANGDLQAHLTLSGEESSLLQSSPTAATVPPPPPPGGNVLLQYEGMDPPRQPIFRLVITGGPCSGKSTCMEYFKAELERMGYTVFCLPEVATMLMTAGARLWLTPDEAKVEKRVMEEKEKQEKLREEYVRSALRPIFSAGSEGGTTNDKTGIVPIPPPGAKSPPTGNAVPPNPPPAVTTSTDDARSALKELLQRRVLQNMLVHEDTFVDIAVGFNTPTVILIDRGTLDGSAYCVRSDWDSILCSTNYNEEELVEARYDAVMHFVTAADGAEKFYTLENNGTRHETVSEAVAQDGMTRRAWRSFPYVHIIDNSTAFQPKLNRALRLFRLLLPSTSLPTYERLTQKSLADLLSSKSTPLIKEVRRAIAHTGSAYWAGHNGPTAVETGIQRLFICSRVDWKRLAGDDVTKKQVSNYFILPNSEGSELRETEMLVRIIGSVGRRRPLYLRRARFRAQKDITIQDLAAVPSCIVRDSKKKESAERKPDKESATTAPSGGVNRRNNKSESSSRSGSTTPQRTDQGSSTATLKPAPPSTTPKIFEASCRLTEEDFYTRIQRSSPALPLVEKDVYRFVHKLNHFNVFVFIAPEEMKDKIVLVGPAGVKHEELPEWISVSMQAFEESWISHEIVL